MDKSIRYSIAITFLGSIAVFMMIITTFVTLTQYSQLEQSLTWLTGAATSSGTGETNLTISAITSITNQNVLISFGSGRVNSTCDYCIMDSNNVNLSLYSNGSNLGTAEGRCCVGFTPAGIGFLLENTGNVNVSVGYTCAGNCTHDKFIGGTLAGTMGGLEVKITANSVASQSTEDGGLDTQASCQGGGSYYRTAGYNLTNGTSYTDSAFGRFGAAVYTSLMSTGHWICGNNSHYPLMPNNDKDAFVMDVNITLPSTAQGSGVRSSLILTFNATAEG